MKLSPNFDQSEFERGASIPEDCVPIFADLCDKILEPIRAFAEVPILITSGYRSPETNAMAHGIPNSEHMASPNWCAADFVPTLNRVKPMSIRFLFDWIRNNAALPFHQVILEHDVTGGSIIHISYQMAKIDQRKALEGATHNAAPYISWEVAEYNPAVSPTGQENA